MAHPLRNFILVKPSFGFVISVLVNSSAGMKRFLLIFCLLLPLPTRAKTLVEQAYEAGVLDIETALIYRLQAARDPESIPAEYREVSVRPFCGTPLILQASQARQHLSTGYGRRLAKILARPFTEHEQVSLSGHFRVHYDLTGSKAVNPTDDDDNSVPDYIDEVIRTLDQTWALQVDSLGFKPPPTDGGLGGGPEYDVYIVDLGRGGAYGYTYPEMGGKTTHSYLELDNDYTDLIYSQTRGFDALHVTVAHEFSHGTQFGYYQRNDSVWWQEATSTWMEEVAYPEVDDYLQYVPSFLRSPEKSLDSGNRFSSDFHIYGASIFAHFLDQRYGRFMIRAIWEELGRSENAHLENFDYVIRQEVKSNLAGAMSEFALWNYFTGPRHSQSYYHEGDKYPSVRLRDIHIDTNAPKSLVEYSDEVDHMASTYLHLEPRLKSGGVTIDFQKERGRWDLQLILASHDTVEMLPVNTIPIHIPGWDRYEDVVLVISETDLSGFAYEYALSVEYDPDLIDAPAPEELRFAQNFPNPFRPEIHLRTVFSFDLDQPSPDTWLSIFTTDGRLVRRYDLGSLPARTYTRAWDGTNSDGELVGSGLYYYMLQAAGKRAVRTLAVLRENR